MSRMSLVLAMSLAMAAVLSNGCSDDTKGKKPDSRGPKAEAGQADGGLVDYGPLNDSPKQPDGKVVSPDGRTPDATIVTGDGRTDGPVTKTDGVTGDLPVKMDGPVIKPDGVVPPPSNAKCSAPKVLTLAGTPAKVVENGDTTTSVDEYATISCGNSLGPWPGPQLYYKVKLTGGKKYKAVLVPTFDAALYAFPAGTACDATAIDTACKGPASDPTNIYNSDIAGKSNEIIRIAPATTGDWIIVVDSYSDTVYGTFSLTISEVVPPPNGTCATAQTLTVTSKATVTGDTSDAANEFSSNVKCGGTSAFIGPQLYYRFTIPNNKGVTVTLKPTFSAYVYFFPASANCVATAIDTACGSGGKNGMVFGSVSSGSTDTIYFVPDTGGDYILVVDSAGASAGGPFDLTVQEYTAPTNSKCTKPQAITLTTSPVTINGDTTGAPNQFGKLVTCNAYTYDGSQLYYKVTLQAGKTYTFDLTPSASWDPAIYAFTDVGCSATTIDTQCASMVADDGYTGDPEQLKITPTATTTYIIAIDAADPTDVGTFTLKISW